MCGYLIWNGNIKMGGKIQTQTISIFIKQQAK
jgi:hypothetical protein